MSTVKHNISSSELIRLPPLGRSKVVHMNRVVSLSVANKKTVNAAYTAGIYVCTDTSIRRKFAVLHISSEKEKK